MLTASVRFENKNKDVNDTLASVLRGARSARVTVSRAGTATLFDSGS
jgi:hypothetical protein